VVRYADDFVVFCASREDAESALGALKDWLAKRGLTLAEDKTRILHLTQGVDFLGFTIRHDPDARTRTGYKLRITPSKRSVTKLRETMRTQWRQLPGANVQAVLKRLNPLIRGWAHSFRGSVASWWNTRLDDWMFLRARSYVRHSHPAKPWSWLLTRYWGRLNAHRADTWVFGDKDSGRYRLTFKWFHIHRHVLVRGAASPDDGRLRAYWANRDKAKVHALSRSRQQLARNQHDRCPICRQRLFNEEDLHQHPVEPRAAGGGDASEHLSMVHRFCHHQIHSQRADPLGSGAQGHATHLPLA
jgi:RNA-directed DNA polymerase